MLSRRFQRLHTRRLALCVLHPILRTQRLLAVRWRSLVLYLVQSLNYRCEQRKACPLYDEPAGQDLNQSKLSKEVLGGHPVWFHNLLIAASDISTAQLLGGAFTRLDLQSRFRDRPVKIYVVCSQNGTEVLKGLKDRWGIFMKSIQSLHFCPGRYVVGFDVLFSLN